MEHTETRGNYRFVLTVGMFILLAKLLVLIFTGKDSFHLAVDARHCLTGDRIFHVITWMGDGLFALAVILIAALFRFRYALFTALAFLSSGLLVQLLKHLAFSGAMRPVKYFSEQGIDLNLVDGVNYHSFLSFPSGHSASAWAVFTALALISNKKALQIPLLLLAALTAFSRVYLSQHFLMDTFAGGLLGFIAALAFWRMQKRWNKAWLDSSFINLMKR
ncbi:MAG TPA: phosphatase PAP2 family protein [Bacteroidales bacterium]|nr:phosphatase PAP2 family protein [Bacteroidales bacterium]